MNASSRRSHLIARRVNEVPGTSILVRPLLYVRGMARKNIRTDEHRPGAIVPANYSVAVSYTFGASYGWDLGMPIVRMHEMCAAALGQKVYGTAGKCGVCGARYCYGDLWVHMSGDLVHVGHECSEKYLGWVDRTEWQLAHERELAKHKVLRTRERAAEKRATFLAANPDLAEILAVDHYIIRDIARKYENTGKMSDAQLDLVRKIARELTEKATKKAATAARIASEVHVAAPVGRHTFVGKIVSVKERDGFRGGVEYKAIIVVPTAAGSWTAWCTVPADVLRASVSGVYYSRIVDVRDALVGATVEVTATMTRSDRDEHFAFAKRPTWRVLDDGQLPIPAPKATARANGHMVDPAIVASEYYVEIEILFTAIAWIAGLSTSEVVVAAAGAELARGSAFALDMAGLEAA